MCIFFSRHTAPFLHLEILDCTSPLCLETILNREVTNKKHRNAKNTAINRWQKGHLFIIKKKLKQGVPAVVRLGPLWSTGFHVHSPARHSELKDPALPQLWLKSWLQLGSDPWPRNSICHREAKDERQKNPKPTKQQQQKKPETRGEGQKKKKKKILLSQFPLINLSVLTGQLQTKPKCRTAL